VQTDEGCAASPWRFTQDGYLREILTARVYDVAVRKLKLSGSSTADEPTAPVVKAVPHRQQQLLR
jgi:replication initiation and membrane attachment protein DnaB